MKSIFSFLLFLFSIAALSAQVDSAEWHISKAMHQYERSELLTIKFQALEMDSVAEGWGVGLHYFHFREAIHFQDGCQLLFPKDEKVLQITDRYVFTETHKYEASVRILSKYVIQDCQFQLAARNLFPFDTEIFVGKEGDVLLTDCYMDFGQHLFVLDAQLEVQLKFRPFEQGFHEVIVEEEGDKWLILLKKDYPRTPAETVLFTFDKQSNQFSSLFSLPYPRPQSWYPFTLRNEGFLSFTIGRKPTFCDHKGQIIWQLEQKAYHPTIGEKHLAFISEDSIYCYHILSGKRQWVLPLKKLEGAKLTQAEKEKLSSCDFWVKDMYLHEKGLFLVNSWSCVGISANYAPRGIFIDHQGNILKDESLGESLYFLKIFSQTDPISLLIDDDFQTYDIPD